MVGILIGVGAMEATEETDKAQAEADGTSKCNKTKCPPCKPYLEGTIGYIGPRIVQRGADGTRNNGGIGISILKYLRCNKISTIVLVVGSKPKK